MRPLPSGAYYVGEGPAEEPSGRLWTDEALASLRLRQPALSLSMRAPSLYSHADQRSPSVESLVPPTPSPTSVSPGRALLSPLASYPYGNAFFAGDSKQQNPGIQGDTEGAAGYKDEATSGLRESVPGRPHTRYFPETGNEEAPSAPPQCKAGACASSPYPPTEASRSPRHQTGCVHFRSYDSLGAPWCPSCRARARFCYSHSSKATVSPQHPTGDPSDLSGPSSVSLLSPTWASGDTVVTSKDPWDSSAASRTHPSSSRPRGSLSSCSEWSSPSLVRDSRGSPRRNKASKVPSKGYQIPPGPSRRPRGSSTSFPAQQEPTFVNTLRRPQTTLPSSITLFFGGSALSPHRSPAAASTSSTTALATTTTAATSSSSNGPITQQRGSSRGKTHMAEKGALQAGRRCCASIPSQASLRQEKSQTRDTNEKRQLRGPGTPREGRGERKRGRASGDRRRRRRKVPSEETPETWSPIPSLVRIIRRAASRPGFPFILQQQQHEPKPQQDPKARLPGPDKETSLTEQGSPIPEKDGHFLALFRDSAGSHGNTNHLHDNVSSNTISLEPLPVAPSSIVLQERKKTQERTSDSPLHAGPPEAPAARHDASPLHSIYSRTASSSSPRRTLYSRPEGASVAAEAAATSATQAAAGQGAPTSATWGWSWPTAGRCKVATAAAAALEGTSASGPASEKPTDGHQDFWWKEKTCRGGRRRGPRNERQGRHVGPPEASALPETLSGAAPATAPLPAALAAASSAVAEVAGHPTVVEMRPAAIAAARASPSPSTVATAAAAAPVYPAAKHERDEAGDTSGAATALRLIAAFRARTLGTTGGSQLTTEEEQQSRNPNSQLEGEQRHEGCIGALGFRVSCGSSKGLEDQCSSKRNAPPAVELSIGPNPSRPLCEGDSSNIPKEIQEMPLRRMKSNRSYASLTLRPRRCCLSPRDTEARPSSTQKKQPHQQDFSLGEDTTGKNSGPLMPLRAMAHDFAAPAKSPAVHALERAPTETPASVASPPSAAPQEATAAVHGNPEACDAPPSPRGAVQKLYLTGDGPSQRQRTAATSPQQQEEQPLPQQRRSRTQAPVGSPRSHRDTSKADGDQKVEDASSAPPTAEAATPATATAAVPTSIAPTPCTELAICVRNQSSNTPMARGLALTCTDGHNGSGNSGRSKNTRGIRDMPHGGTATTNRNARTKNAARSQQPYLAPLSGPSLREGGGHILRGSERKPKRAKWVPVRILSRHLSLQHQRQQTRESAWKVLLPECIASPQLKQQPIEEAVTGQKAASAIEQTPRPKRHLPVMGSPAAAGGKALNKELATRLRTSVRERKEEIPAGESDGEAIRRKDEIEQLPDRETASRVHRAKAAAASRKRNPLSSCGAFQRTASHVGVPQTTKAETDHPTKLQGGLWKKSPAVAPTAASAASVSPAGEPRTAETKPRRPKAITTDGRKRSLVLGRAWQRKTPPHLEQHRGPPARAGTAQDSQADPTGMVAPQGRREQRGVNIEHFMRLYKHAAVRRQRLIELQVQREKEEAERLQREALSLRHRPPPRRSRLTATASDGWPVAPTRRSCCGGHSSPATGASMTASAISGGARPNETMRDASYGRLCAEEACKHSSKPQLDGLSHPQLPRARAAHAEHWGASSISLSERNQLRALLLRLLAEPEEIGDPSRRPPDAFFQPSQSEGGRRCLHATAGIEAAAAALVHPELVLHEQRHRQQELLQQQQQLLLQMRGLKLNGTVPVRAGASGTQHQRPAHVPLQQQHRNQLQEEVQKAAVDPILSATAATDPVGRWTLPAPRSIEVGPLRASMGFSQPARLTHLQQRNKQGSCSIARPAATPEAVSSQRAPRVGRCLSNLQQPYLSSSTAAPSQQTIGATSSAASAVPIPGQQWEQGRKASHLESKRASTPAPFVCGSTRNSHNILLQQAAAAAARLASGRSSRGTRRSHSTGTLLQKSASSQHRTQQRQGTAAPICRKQQEGSKKHTTDMSLLGVTRMLKKQQQQQQQASVAAAAAAAESAILAAEAASVEAEAEAGAVRAAAAELEALQTRTGLEMLSAYGSARGSFWRFFCGTEDDAGTRQTDEMAATDKRQWEGEARRPSVERLHTTASSLNLLHHASDGASAASTKLDATQGMPGSSWAEWERAPFVD